MLVLYLIDGGRDGSKIQKPLNLLGGEIANANPSAQARVEAPLHPTPRRFHVELQLELFFLRHRIVRPWLQLHRPVHQVHVHVLHTEVPEVLTKNKYHLSSHPFILNE